MTEFPQATRLYDYTIKFVALGDAAVGKTSCIRRYVDGVFQADYVATLGTIFSTKIIQVENPQGQTVLARLILWDLAGQDGYQELRRRYMAGARMGFIAYDVTRRETFETVREWHSRFIKECPEAIVSLLANKIDLENHAVTKHEGEELARSIGASFYQTSAKENQNVSSMFSDSVTRVFSLIETK